MKMDLSNFQRAKFHYLEELCDVKINLILNSSVDLDRLLYCYSSGSWEEVAYWTRWSFTTKWRAYNEPRGKTNVSNVKIILRNLFVISLFEKDWKSFCWIGSNGWPAVQVDNNLNSLNAKTSWLFSIWW